MDERIRKVFLKQFNQEYKNSLDDSRNPHRIINSGNIVCQGYSSFLFLILNGMDKNVSSIVVSVDVLHDDIVEGHTRNLIRIDDDKYSIHGLFVLDPTWDSASKRDKKLIKYF